LTSTANLDAQRKFLQEAAVMVQFRHRNVRSLLGVVHRPTTTPLLVRYCVIDYC
jgi:hypothetical protein